MDARQADHLPAAGGARRLSRRAMAQAGGGLAIGATAAGRLGRSASARQADATPEPGQPPSWEQIDRLFADAAPETVMLAAELIDGRCLPIHASNADSVFPVASSFKLWVLGALALKIQAGEIAWEQPVAIEERYKSVLGGGLDFAQVGTWYTVRYLAERMMQKSDNTATDHLFHLVGRESVEGAMTAMGHHNPALNVPIMSTREIALLRLRYPIEFLDDYHALPAKDRRALLDNEIAKQALVGLREFGPGPTAEMDRTEWFASRRDLAAAVAWLDAASSEPGLLPVTEVMSLETLIPFDHAVWPYVGFKIGDEPGLLNGTWLLRRADGRRFAYSVAFKNLDAEIDIAAATAAMEAGRDRLALAP